MSTLAVASRHADPTSTWLRWLPSPLALFVAALGGVLAVIAVARGIQDADYHWHVTTGRLIAETGRVPTTDPYSFTWAGRPWTAHEWLSELFIYRLVEAVGPLGAVIVFGAVTAGVFAVLGSALRARGVGLPAIATASCAGAVAVIPYMTVRPQVISWLLLAALVAGLMALRPERRRWSLLLVPLFALWSNLHGLYVVGLGALAVYVLFSLAGRTPMAAGRRWIVGSAVGAALASALTPAGPMGLLYPLRYVEGGDWGLAHIAEWQSPNFHDPASVGLLALILLVAANGGRAAPGWLNALSLVGVAMSLLALRNAPVAVVFAVPVLAIGLDDRLRAVAASRRARRPATPRTELAPRDRVARRILETALTAGLVVAAAILFLPQSPILRGEPLGSADLPRAGVDRLESVAPDSRVLVEYGWGGHVISRLHDDGGRVFVDGRNDMYDEAILDDYTAIRDADPGWPALVERYAVEAILFPPSAPLVRGAAQSEGWCEVLRDEAQVLLMRGDCDAWGPAT